MAKLDSGRTLVLNNGQWSDKETGEPIPREEAHRSAGLNNVQPVDEYTEARAVQSHARSQNGARN
jgi:hypothetical protein